MHQVALFPIPNVVAFPGTVVPLHVFEPRYRKMINESVEADRMIAVCHTRKEIRPARPTQTMAEALSSNQGTYEPCSVFSAGSCTIMETTSDGRIYANVNMTTRLKLTSEVQTLPYRIVDCDELQDSPLDENDKGISDIKQSITASMLQLTGRDNIALRRVLADSRWTDLEAAKFSFKVFQFIRFEAEAMQALLEMTDTVDRLQTIDTYLREATAR